MDIKYHETSRVVDVVDTYKQIKDELGVGNYSGNIVELSGNGHSDIAKLQLLENMRLQNKNKPVMVNTKPLLKESLNKYLKIPNISLFI